MEAATAHITARVPRTIDDLIIRLQHDRDIPRSEAVRQLLELGAVALAAVERDKPRHPFRFVTIPAEDAADDDEPLLDPEDYAS